MQDLAKYLIERKPKWYGLSRSSRDIWAAFRGEHGLVAKSVPLLTPPEANLKLNKTRQYGLTLAPAGASGVQVCRHRTKGCESACVISTAGNSLYPMVKSARTVKTLFLKEYPNEFLTLLREDIHNAAASEQQKYGTTPMFRLNVGSDLPWELISPELFEEFADISFYDYTKWKNRDTPDNYKLTYSAHEKFNDADITNFPLNVAVVFSTKRSQALPATYQGLPVIDGDLDDNRFNDPQGVVVGLRAKGAGRKDTTGFVRAVG